MRKLCLVAAALAVGLSGLAADPERWNAVSGGFSNPVFYPTYFGGVYDPGTNVTVRFSCAVTNGLTGTVSAVVDMKEFGGATVSNVWSGSFAAEKPEVEFSLTAPKRYGHYTLVMRLAKDGQPLGTVQSAFVVAPSPSDDRDPYFVVDKNCWEPTLLEKMKRFGFGGWYTHVTGLKDALTKTDAEKEDFYKSLAPANRKGNLAVKGFTISGCYGPNVIGAGSEVFTKANERLSKGLWPLTDEDFAKVREHARRTAAALKDLVDEWVINEEFDSFHIITRHQIKENQLVWTILSAQVQENISMGLKEGNPDCTVAVIGPCCGDYFWNPDKFGMTRRLLSTMRGHFDYLALDAYSGNWNGFAGKITPPEDAFAKLLRAGAAVSVECGGPNKVVNAERCAAVDTFSAYDGQLARDQADYTSRSMIINKTVEECTKYTLHILANRWPAIRARDEKKPLKSELDLGIWQMQVAADGKVKAVPRPAVVTAGVAARKLAFATKPKLFELKDNLYAATFDVGTDRALAAVWTTREPVKTRLTVPADTVFTDVGGNDSPVSAGEAELLLTTSPVYFTLPRASRAAFEQSLGAMKVTWRSPEAARRHVPIFGKMPKEPTFVLAAPDAVYPPMAVMPEYGFFGRDLRYTDKVAPWPYAEVRMAWKAEGLAAEIRIFNKPYVAGVDKVRLRLLSSDGLALYGEDGYARRPAFFDAKNVSGDENGSVWRFTMPWTDLAGMKAAAGAHVACNVVCDCVPLGRTDKTQYALANDDPKCAGEQFQYNCVFLELK